jgi:hypothetical protein
METLQPYLSYFGIGAAIVGAIALLLWIGFASMLSAATEGIPELLGKFFNYLAMGDLETAYSLTSARFQQSISQPQMRKLVRKHQIDKHKRLLLPVSLPEGLEVERRYERDVVPGYQKFIDSTRTIADITIYNSTDRDTLVERLKPLMAYCDNELTLENLIGLYKE